MIFSEKEEFEKLTATPAKAAKRWVKDKYIASFTEMGEAHGHHSSWYSGTHELIRWVCWQVAAAGQRVGALAGFSLSGF